MSLRLALAASLLSLAALSLGCGARSELDGLEPAGTGGSGGSGGGPTVPESCKEQGITYIYVVMDDKRLYAFDPPSGIFAPHGSLDCPDTDQAFSMAVDRRGVAFVEFEPIALMGHGHLFEVDTKDGSCTETSYVPDPSFDRFGMGYTANTNNAGEKLYLASGDGVLATLDTKTFERTEIGPFSKPLGEAELTGTADGRLFAFGVDAAMMTHLAEVDPKTATVITDHDLPIGQGTSAWAFANWGGDFYFFTLTTGPNSVVTRLDPMTHIFKHVADAPGRIVGSGVSTCAPL
jgi:hypothetical protein